MPERLRSAPDLPTIAEQGLPGYAMWTWYGVFATGGSPPAAVERLSRELRAALADAKVREQIEAQGAEPSGGTPAEFRALVAADIEKWTRVVKAAGVKAD
jgi:tripartite-type tricarboxylate transporter receptor subunit TctC